MDLIGGIIAGTGLAAGAWENKKNREFQNSQNDRDYKNQTDMYAMQRKDALADWNANNQYNSPIQQMQRLREAGLSPNLIYGNGAQNTANMARASTPNPSSHPAAKMDNSYVVPSLNAYQQNVTQGLQQKQIQATTDNLAEQNRVLQQDAMLKQATTAKTLQDTARSKYDLQMSQELKDQIIMKARLENDKLGFDTKKVMADTQFTLDQNTRNKVMQTYDIKKTLQEIEESKARTLKTEDERNKLKMEFNKLYQQYEIDEFQKQMHAKGLTPHDALWQRMMAEIAASLSEIYKKIPDGTLAPAR